MNLEKRTGISTPPIMGTIFGLLPFFFIFLWFLSKGELSPAWVVLAFCLAAPMALVLGITGLRHAHKTIRYRVEKVLSWISIVLGGIAVMACAAVWQIVRESPRLHVPCTAQYDSALEQWLMANRTDVYPNVQGRCELSAREMGEYVKGGSIDPFVYVPGLQESDPDTMILMYMNKKARERKEGVRTSLLFPKAEMKWLVITHKWPHTHYERGLWLTDEEFRQKLLATLDYIKEQKRPFWENIYQEHRSFLVSADIADGAHAGRVK